MVIENYSYPHPVLGLNDDIEGNFNVSLKVERNSENRKLRFHDINYNIDNNYISSLVKNGTAGIFFKIYCSSTFRTWTIMDPDDYFELDENELHNKIEINIYIVTKTQITDYYDKSFNADFGNFKFSLEEKEIIGMSGTLPMKIEKTDEKLGVGNIFKFFSHDTTKSIEFGYQQDKIHIIYPKDGDNHPPNSLFKISPWTAYNLFILPALQGAFKIAEKKESEVKDYEWYNILIGIFPKDKWENDPYRNAQNFLDGDLPIIKSYRELKDLTRK